MSRVSCHVWLFSSYLLFLTIVQSISYCSTLKTIINMTNQKESIIIKIYRFWYLLLLSTLVGLLPQSSFWLLFVFFVYFLCSSYIRKPFHKKKVYCLFPNITKSEFLWTLELYIQSSEQDESHGLWNNIGWFEFKQHIMSWETQIIWIFLPIK